MSIVLFRAQHKCLYMCTGTNEGSRSRGKKDENLRESSKDFYFLDPSIASFHNSRTSVPFKPFKEEFKIIHYCQSVFNRQVLISRDSMRFFVRIKGKKVRVKIKSIYVLFLSNESFMVLQNFKSKQILI